MPCCPWCLSPSVIAHGKAKSGWRRMRCKSCGKTFSDTTETIFQSRKMDDEKIRRMVNLMINDTKLKAIVDSVGIFSHDRLMAFLEANSFVYKSVTKEAHAKLQPVNSFIAEIEHFARVHTGIRTEYLDSYCAWIAFKSSINGKNIGQKIDDLIRTCFRIRTTFKQKHRY